MEVREKHEGFPGQRLVVVPRPMVMLALGQPLLKQLLPTDAGFYPRARGHQCTRKQGCRETVFIYCSQGRGWCELGGQRHEVSRDQLLVLPADLPHTYGAAERRPWTIHWFHAVGSNVPFYLEKLGVTPGQPVISVRGDVGLFSVFEEVLEDLEHGSTLRHLTYAVHSLAHLLGIILRKREQASEGPADARERVTRSIEFMKAHLHEPLRVERLAALVNLSRSHYTTLFGRIMGYAPLHYLNHLRLQRAVQLLNTTSLPIKQISEQVGFPDQLYFSRAFRKLHGHAPSERRHRYMR